MSPLNGFVEELDPIAGTTVLMRESYKPTDMGNAERLVDRYGDMIRYCAELMTWFIWDGRRWAPDTTLKIRQLGKATVLHIIEEVPRLKMNDRSEERTARIALTKWAYTSENSQRITAMLHLAESDERIALNASEFDANQYLMTVQNGTIDYYARELREHRREDLITKITSVPYDPLAASDEWDERVAEVLDEEQAEFLRRACGMALTGINRDKALFVLYGEPNTRKSTLLDAIFKTLGDYAAPFNISVFQRAELRPGGARADLVSLEGVRAAQCSEVPRGMKFNDAFLKSVTSENPQSARGLFEKRNRNIRPQTKFFIETNFLPEINFDDDASFNRFHIISFRHAIPLEDCDPLIKEFLLEDANAQKAILAWMVKGCYDWQEYGLMAPASVNAARTEYQKSMNPLASFVSGDCVLDPGAETETGVLWERFKLWATPEEKRNVPNPKSFGIYLSKMGFKTSRSRNARMRCGIRPRGIGDYDEGDDDA
jgi:putative DNA primase/helicase